MATGAEGAITRLHSEGNTCSYMVYTPKGFTGEGQYPALYLMPFDGYSAQQYTDDGIEALLDGVMESGDAAPMVVVMPEFTGDEDLPSVLSDLTEDVEKRYPVIPDRKYRAVCGAGAGGYMAYAAALRINPGMFMCAGSVMGDFTSADNPWIKTYGAVYDTVRSMEMMAGKAYDFLSDRYFYIEAPNGAQETTAEGGTTDIGGVMEKLSNPYCSIGGMSYLQGTPDTRIVEYAVLDGIDDSAYRMAGLRRAVLRFSSRFTEDGTKHDTAAAPAENDADREESTRLITDEYDSKSAGRKKEFRIYLPEGYDDPGNEKRYPVLYMLHGINCTGEAFEIDGIDTVLDDAIRGGRIAETIVVMPDDMGGTSFWSGKCADMVLSDLIPYIDGKYRTHDDAKHRYIGGCSMGGAGAVMLGLFHPELFSGVISFYGALDYTSAVQEAMKLPPEHFDEYAIYMACGNQDMYNFYIAQEQMSRVLTEKGAEHRHIVDSGTHTSSFYLPRLAEAIRYVEKYI
ncbi:MAG: alpha/beta hydrolase-fold protein [Lachnospiraceae bacterium]|nr:alpha/beta hydrolase-fold protein [Lachnospiraceae bacterium]